MSSTAQRFLLVFTGLLIATPTFSTEDIGKNILAQDNSVDEPVNALAEKAVNKIRAQFEALRLDEKDFKLSPGWDLPLTIRSIENFFGKPLDIPISASRWLDKTENVTTLSDTYDIALNILGVTPPLPENLALKSNANIPKNLPLALKLQISSLLSSIQTAQPYLDRAVDSVPPLARQEFLRQNDWADADTGMIKQEISSRRIKKSYEQMQKFSETDLYTAGQIIFTAIDKVLPHIKEEFNVPHPIQWKTDQGVVLINGSGDDIYDEETLEDVVLLIDLGGNNTYKSPVANAHEKEIRIVIDLGADVKIQSEIDSQGNAGSGTFGIGIFIAPNSKGTKTIHTASFSQGCGLAGIGALILKGTADLSAERNVQGTGFFGVGILSVKDSNKSIYDVVRSGQGAGFTRGVGIFIHEGDEASITGGLVQPDPREPLGSISMCQGVGFGPRAYAGGGVGIALVKGNNNSVQGSYFSQGVGYWHGFGAFRLKGDHNTLQARRYDLGSGVHSAFGHFDLYGNSNRVLNWGVGPSYGWDRAIGSSLLLGDDNEYQTQWGAGTASIGSLSFCYYQGNRNKMKLCDFGTDNFVHDEPAYSIQIVEGFENKMQCLGAAATDGKPITQLRRPWALYHIEGTTLHENLDLKAPEWPEFSRKEAVEREMVDLQSVLQSAPEKSPLDEVSDLVDVASAFSLDKASPRQAIRQLLTLPEEKISYLIDVLDPVAVDQLIQLSSVIPAYGDATTKIILNRIPDAAIQKKAVLINFLRMARPATVFPSLMKLIRDPTNERLKGNIVRTMAQLLNKDTGAEPGSQAMLMAMAKMLSNPSSKPNKKILTDLLSRIRFGDSFGLLASGSNLTTENRASYIDSAQEDLTANIDEKTVKTFITILCGARKENLKIINEQLAVLTQVEPDVRRELLEMLTSTRPATVYTAVVAIGQIANSEDANKLAPLLEHESTSVREAAAVALARMGLSAIPILNQTLLSENPRTRCLVMAGLSQSVSPKIIPLIERGLTDVDPLVRSTALLLVQKPPECLQSKRDDLIKRAKKILMNEENPNVKLALLLLN